MKKKFISILLLIMVILVLSATLGACHPTQPDEPNKPNEPNKPEEPEVPKVEQYSSSELVDELLDNLEEQATLENNKNFGFVMDSCLEKSMPTIAKITLPTA